MEFEMPWSPPKVMTGLMDIATRADVGMNMEALCRGGPLTLHQNLWPCRFRAGYWDHIHGGYYDEYGRYWEEDWGGYYDTDGTYYKSLGSQNWMRKSQGKPPPGSTPGQPLSCLEPPPTEPNLGWSMVTWFVYDHFGISYGKSVDQFMVTWELIWIDWLGENLTIIIKLYNMDLSVYQSTIHGYSWGTSLDPHGRLERPSGWRLKGLGLKMKKCGFHPQKWCFGFRCFCPDIYYTQT